jgi:micrococcal nuclease
MIDNFTRRAKEVRVIDGDTLEVKLDFGYNFGWEKVTIRLLGIQAPETKGTSKAAGLVSKEYLQALVNRGTVHIHTPDYNKKTFDRFLSNVYVVDAITQEEVFINQKMIDDGYAVPFMV